MAPTTSAPAFAGHALRAWARWTARHGASAAALLPEERQAQYQLLASGLVAAMSEDEVAAVWNATKNRNGEDGSEPDLWAWLSPLPSRFREDPARVHFLLVVATELLVVLKHDARIKEIPPQQQQQQRRADIVVTMLVLPVLQSRRYQRLHAIALILTEELLDATVAPRGVVASLLTERVGSILKSVGGIITRDPGQDHLQAVTTKSGADTTTTTTTTGENDDDDEDKSEEQCSYVSLCRAFQLVWLATPPSEWTQSITTTAAALQTQSRQICEHAIAQFAAHPRFLRAVSVHLMPSLVETFPDSIAELVDVAIATWESASSSGGQHAETGNASTSLVSEVRQRATRRGGGSAGSEVSNLLYMLCLLLPRDPSLVRHPGLQRVIAFALTHSDPLLRKQALHLLQVAFSHYTLQGESSDELTAWQSFLLASEVIQLHHEQHLLEQVWPQVDDLIRSRLLMAPPGYGQPQEEEEEEEEEENERAAVEHVWPVRFSFSWMQSLLMRVLRHENPVVRRLFLSNFMQTCTDQLTLHNQGRGVKMGTVMMQGFASDPQFQSFVFQSLLRACNDPLMYKSSRREPFMVLITQFLAAFLTFRVQQEQEQQQQLQKETHISNESVITVFTLSACDAVFGEGSVVHSPEAIISFLQVFHTPELAATMTTAIAASNGALGLSESALDRLRFILQVYVLRSFPQSMRAKTLRALQAALTDGFTCRHTQSLASLARVLAVFPSAHLVEHHALGMRKLRDWLCPSESTTAITAATTTMATPSQSAVIEPVVVPSFRSGLAAAWTSYLCGNGSVTAEQLARLTLFTADVDTRDDAAQRIILQRAPIAEVRTLSTRASSPSLPISPSLVHERLLLVLGQLELELAALGAHSFSGASPLTTGPLAHHSLLFVPIAFLASLGVVDVSTQPLEEAEPYGARSATAVVFAMALQRANEWLTAAWEGDHASDDEDTQMAEQRMLLACAVVATQLATYHMEEDGDLTLLTKLSCFCEDVQRYLASVVAKDASTSGETTATATATAAATTPTPTTRSAAARSLQDRMIAVRFLALVSSQPRVLDALPALSRSAHVLPLVLDCRARRGGLDSSRHVSDTLFLFSASKWKLVHHIVAASTLVPTALLQRILSDCVDSLFTAGEDAAMLLDMVHVLALVLSRLGASLLQAPHDADADGSPPPTGEERLESIFDQVWTAYCNSKPKPDALMRAVVHCLFQPAFLRRKELVAGPGAFMKRWYRVVLTYGEVRRPHVVFHLACRLAQCWRSAPASALYFMDEIVTLLVYKEPVIADKQQSPEVPDVHMRQQQQQQRQEQHQNGDRSVTSPLSVKERYVRLIILSFLDELTVEVPPVSYRDDAADDQVAISAERQLLDGVLTKLLALNVGDDWQRQHMLNSDGFGKKLRCWQALSVLSRHVHAHNLDSFSDLLWRAFLLTQLPAVRYYMEVVAMRLATRFPQVTLHGHVLPLLTDFSLTPQVAASLLLITGFVVHRQLCVAPEEGGSRRTSPDENSIRDDTHAVATRTLMAAMLPWVHASHGHTRVMVQFLLSALLPRYLHYMEATHATLLSATDGEPDRRAGDEDDEHAFLRGMLRFLSENKDCRRMFRRQGQQFESLRPERQCTMVGLLTSASLNEFHELYPEEAAVSLSAQLKEAMNAIYQQHQREHFTDGGLAASLNKHKQEQWQLQQQQAALVAAAAEPPLPQAPTTATAGSTLTLASTTNVQRKIDTSAILMDESVLPLAMKDREELDELLNVRARARQRVIVCASLVDKVPNLAGLARTCEIFNAEALVVPNAHVRDDDTFQTISVTAHKWMPLQQVRPRELVAALLAWKRDGYTIVAVEQTAQSECLSQYTFPDKVVIVLGKEKEGVPVDVLRIVDVCVEIPQFGVIRSLNVHVSGALLLWSYTQQHLQANVNGLLR